MSPGTPYVPETPTTHWDRDRKKTLRGMAKRDTIRYNNHTEDGLSAGCIRSCQRRSDVVLTEAF